MSRLIEVEKAIKAVEDCCHELNPSSAISEAAKQAFDKTMELIERSAIPPLESGVAIAPGLSQAVAKTIVESITMGKVLPLAFRERLRPKTVPLLQVMEIAKGLAAVAKKAEVGDPCEALLGCVAKRFRKELLPSRTETRRKYVKKDFADHFITKGTKIPKYALRQTRP